jgi:hypothetical protein
MREGSIRGRLQVYDFAYELPGDSVHDLQTKGLGFQFSFGHQLQPLVNTFQEKSVKINFANHLRQEIVHRIVCRFVRNIVRVDGP